GDRPVMRSDVARADYRRARRRAFMRGVLSWFRRADNALLAFDEVRRGIHAQAQRDGGLREVEIDQIVGSVGRYRDFDRAFLPRQVQTQDRWESVDRAYRDAPVVSGDRGKTRGFVPRGRRKLVRPHLPSDGRGGPRDRRAPRLSTPFRGGPVSLDHRASLVPPSGGAPEGHRAEGAHK